ncbi:hypothetical protein FRC11_002893, partial [Ceratobasidium sp. 423]
MSMSGIDGGRERQSRGVMRVDNMELYLGARNHVENPPIRPPSYPYAKVPTVHGT